MFHQLKIDHQPEISEVAKLSKLIQNRPKMPDRRALLVK